MARLNHIFLALIFANIFAIVDGEKTRPPADFIPPELAREIESTAKACSLIKDNSHRGYALREIAFVFLNAGEYEKALSIAEKREYVYWMVYFEAIDPLIQVNRSRTAFDIVDKLEADHWKIQALLRIARSSVEAKRPEDTIKALEKVAPLQKHSQPQWNLFAEMAELYACIDRPQEAAILFGEAWKAYADGRSMKSCLVDLSQPSLVEIQATAGFPEDAIRRAGIDQSWGLCQIAISLTKNGKDALAERAASKCIPWHRIHAYTEMAIAQAAQGEKDKAEASLNNAEELIAAIGNPVSRHYKVALLIIARVRIGQPLKEYIRNDMDIQAVNWAELAIVLADKNTSEAEMCLKNARKAISHAGGRYNQCLAMLKIAKAQQALGATEQAQTTILRAKDTALAIIANDPEGKKDGTPGLLDCIAMEQKKYGNVAESTRTFEQAVPNIGYS